MLSMLHAETWEWPGDEAIAFYGMGIGTGMVWVWPAWVWVPILNSYRVQCPHKN